MLKFRKKIKKSRKSLMLIYYDFCLTPIGKITMLSEGSGLIAMLTDGSSGKFSELLKNAEPFPRVEVFAQTKQFLYDYFAKKRPSAENISISLEVSDFRLAVYSEISNIPYGEFANYKEIAEKAALSLERKTPPVSTVISAVRANPFPIIIPSHRVVSEQGLSSEKTKEAEIQAFLLRHEYSFKCTARA